LAVHRHYVSVAKQLSLENINDSLEPVSNTVVVPISGIHRGVMNAVRYAKSIAPGRVTAVYVDFEDDATSKLKERWEKLDLGVDLVILSSPYRELTRPILRFICRLERKTDDLLTVVIPEFVPKRWWQHLLHNQSSLLLKGALLFKENVVVTNVPYHLR